MFMRVGTYAAYITVSVLWLFLELSLAEHVFATLFLSGIIINILSMVFVSYKPAYHKYLFMINIALLTYMGFTIPTQLAIIYSVVLMASIVLYLVLIGAMDALSLAISMLLIYISYIIERIIIKSSAINSLTIIVNSIGVNGELFVTVLSWYLSLFIILIVLIITIYLLAGRIMT